VLIFVNLFRIHGDPDRFEKAFADSSEFMTKKDGYRRHRLVKVTEGEPRYLNIAEWADEDALRTAVADPRFEPHVRALREHAMSESLLCEVVQEYEA
jgi:monooxygenase